MSEWQPIDTAPKDLGVILFANGGEYEVFSAVGDLEVHTTKIGEGYWESGDWGWANDSCSCCHRPIEGLVSHWMPLPNPPS